MNYLDWPVESTAFYGPIGGLVPIPVGGKSTISESVNDDWVFRRTLSGRRIAQRLPFARRSWDVALQSLTERELGGLHGIRFMQSAVAQCHWICPDMHDNLVDPRWGTFVEALRTSTYVPGGPQRVGGLILPASAIDAAPNGKGLELTGNMPVPPDGRKVTASAYLSHTSTDQAALYLRWNNYAGQQISYVGSAFVKGALTRATVTATPPKDATSFSIYCIGASVAAGQQVTWTGSPVDYTTPRGCNRAVLSEPKWDFDGDDLDGVYRKASFDVQEVG